MALKFHVHFGGRVLRGGNTRYEGGESAIHPEPYDPDLLSYFEIVGIAKGYGWTAGDQIFYLQPETGMDDGLKLVKSDADVLQMVAAHLGRETVSLYLVSYAGETVRDERGILEILAQGQRQRARLEDLHNPWWESRVSDDEDIYDDQWEQEDKRGAEEHLGSEAGPSGEAESVGQLEQQIGMEAGPSGTSTGKVGQAEETSMDAGALGASSERVGEPDVGDLGVNAGPSEPSTFQPLPMEYSDDDSMKTDEARSDILESPPEWSDEDEEDSDAIGEGFSEKANI